MEGNTLKITKEKQINSNENENNNIIKNNNES
jgi:hypothetical protein